MDNSQIPGVKVIDRKHFYDTIKSNGLFSSLNQTQVDGIEAMLNEWDKRGLTDLRWLAYIFATTYHETGKTMQPIEEIGRGKNRKYGKKVKYTGESYITPDKLYYGRGHTQNTWYEMYDTLTKQATKDGKHWNFLEQPELLLQMEPSIWATFHCMVKGVYTGKSLKSYFNETTEDWINARRIINGTDKADLIAGYGKLFFEGLV